MSDAGQMNDGFHVPEQRTPFDRAGEIGDRNRFHGARKNVRRLPHGGTHAVPLRRKVVDEGASDEAGGAGHQHVHQVFPFENRASRPATSAAPAARNPVAAMAPGNAMDKSASITSATLTANTCATISVTTKPPAAAR